MKNWILALAVSLIASTSFATSSQYHLYPNSKIEDIPKSSKNASKSAPTCLIKITNDSHDDILVYGTFDDGTPLQPFIIYAYESSHYISLFYYGFCHAGMDINIDTTSGLRLYNQYTWVNTRLRIMQGWFKPYIVMDNS
ncbi:MAG: hypothetical protein EBQ95_08430 [Gammaproteobacteria bacterium]|nr:hypothetical protein [Gammaproteobacteria bacterium]